MTVTAFDYQALVVGGGAAGPSAALVLGRARGATLLIDAGEQSNLPARSIGGLLGRGDITPADLYAPRPAHRAAERHRARRRRPRARRRVHGHAR
jgi:thioredoxin reductase